VSEESVFAVIGESGFIKKFDHQDEALELAEKYAKTYPGHLYHVLGTITTVVCPVGETVWNSDILSKPVQKIATRKLGRSLGD